jgi:hypothetical protein
MVSTVQAGIPDSVFSVLLRDTNNDGRGGTDIGTVTVNLAPGNDDHTQNIVSITASGADVIVRSGPQCDRLPLVFELV